MDYVLSNVDHSTCCKLGSARTNSTKKVSLQGQTMSNKHSKLFTTNYASEPVRSESVDLTGCARLRLGCHVVT